MLAFDLIGIASPELNTRARAHRVATGATATRAAEAAAAATPTRAAAEGATVLDTRREHRYAEILAAAGVPGSDIDNAKTADQWRALVARMHHAERLGITLDAVTVQARTDPSAEPPMLASPLRQYEGHLVSEMGKLTQRPEQTAALEHAVMEHRADL
jgi:hypothetical protein